MNKPRLVSGSQPLSGVDSEWVARNQGQPLSGVDSEWVARNQG
jgi:hypothetical protein